MGRGGGGMYVCGRVGLAENGANGRGCGHASGVLGRREWLRLERGPTAGKLGGRDRDSEVRARSNVPRPAIDRRRSLGSASSAFTVVSWRRKDRAASPHGGWLAGRRAQAASRLVGACRAGLAGNAPAGGSSVVMGQVLGDWGAEGLGADSWPGLLLNICLATGHVCWEAGGWGALAPAAGWQAASTSDWRSLCCCCC